MCFAKLCRILTSTALSDLYQTSYILLGEHNVTAIRQMKTQSWHFPDSISNAVNLYLLLQVNHVEHNITGCQGEVYIFGLQHGWTQ